MNPCAEIFTITEYGGFVQGKLSFAGYAALPKPTFDAIESFILANHSENRTETLELLSLSVRRGIGKVITARNYVGIIAMKNGIVIEILPKIHGVNANEQKTKDIFLDMLRTLRNVPFKGFNMSHLKTDRLSLFEIFIAMFATEATMLVKQGLKSSYNSIEENTRFFKGKLNVPQNIKHNYVSKEKFFVRYDEWNTNRPENRLIKSTLRFLFKQTNDARNRFTLHRLLTYFDGIDLSTNYDADFSKCVADRSTSHYEKALSWCKIFLRGNSFTAYAGSEVAFALLFPMEKIFESYVAAKLRSLVPVGMELRTQDARHSLFDHPARAFALRPDIVLVDGVTTVVMDTKWKLLSENERHYGISQSDMYQMYAYGKKYGAKKVVLLYPQPEKLRKTDISFHSEDGVNVEVAFIDLSQPDASFAALIERHSLFVKHECKAGTG